ncbi:hypothetical protein [Niallia sp.]|uniref:hypothetical protein n=1 Tax=Niallia sp. TaxID=2837523 RepID=UPI0028997483|nr:hypothetical protein [Niallia sp.]
MLTYKEQVALAANLMVETERREAIKQIAKENKKPFRRVFHDVVSATHKQRGYKR